MGVELYANNAEATLASGIDASTLTIPLATGKGALFPSPTGGDFFRLTLTQSASETSWETVTITARSGDTLTASARGVEGTAAAWVAGDKAEMRLTAAAIDGFATKTGTETLTNKTLTSPTLTTPALGTPASGDLSNCTFPTLNQNTTGSAAKWTTARALAGNSVDGSAAVAFANKFIVQGTTDAGLSAAQFLGALGTGLVKNTTTTGVLSIAAAGTDYLAPPSGTALLKANSGGALADAVAGTDYLAPAAIGVTVQAYDADLGAVAGLSSNGMIARTGAGTAAVRTITGTANEITVVNGDGVSGDPTISLPAAAKAAGKQTLWVPAAALTPRTTSGPAIGSVESTTNKVMQSTLDYDAATAEYAQIMVRMPKGWNAGTVTASFVWTANSTSTNSVVWAIRATALGDDETIDTAMGTAQTVTDANTSTAYQSHLSAETSAMTIGSTPAAQNLVVFEVYRDASNGSDTLAVDALLLGVNIMYTTSSANDA